MSDPRSGELNLGTVHPARAEPNLSPFGDAATPVGQTAAPEASPFGDTAIPLETSVSAPKRMPGVAGQTIISGPATSLAPSLLLTHSSNTPGGKARRADAEEEYRMNLQEAEAHLGGPVDPDHTMPTGNAFLVGQQIGQRNWGDVGKQFDQLYPNGELHTIGGFPLASGNSTWWYREDRNNSEEPFKQLGTGAMFGESANLRNAANVGSLAITPGKFAPALTGAVTMLGDYSDWALNRLRGFSADIDQWDALSRAGKSGLNASIPMYGIAAARLGTKALFGATKGAVKAVTGLASGEELLNPAETEMGAAGVRSLSWFVSKSRVAQNQSFIDAGLPSLAIGQAGPVPMQLIYKQVSGTSGSAQNNVINQMTTVQAALEKAVQANPTLATDPNFLGKLVESEKAPVLASIVAFKGTGRSMIGGDLQEGVKAALNNSGVMVNRLGADAASKAEDTWIGMPMKPLQDAAASIGRGVLGPGKNVSDRAQFQAPSVPTSAGTVQLAAPVKAIQPILDSINALGDRLTSLKGPDGTIHNAFDQFISLRSRIFKLANSADDATAAQANMLLAATKDMAAAGASEITGKTGAKATSAFQASYQRFTDAITEHEDFTRTVGKLVGAVDPGGVANTLVAPGKLKSLLAVKNALVGTPQEAQWVGVQDGFRSTLQQDLGKAADKITHLQNTDRDVIDAVMSKGEQENWIQLSNIDRTARASLTGKLSEATGAAGQNAVDLAKGASKIELANYTNRSGGVTGPYAQAIRGGVYEDIMNRAKITDPATGIESLSPHALNEAIRYYSIGARRDALSSVMAPADWARLDKLREFSSIVGASHSQVGGSMQAGALAAEFHDIPGIIRTRGASVALAGVKMLGNRTVGAILSSPVGGKIFDAAIANPNKEAFYNLLQHAASYANQNMNEPDRQLDVVERQNRLRDEPISRLPE